MPTKKKIRVDYDSDLPPIAYNKCYSDNDNDNDIPSTPMTEWCENLACDHNTSTIVHPPKFSNITSLDQLIELGKSFHCKTNKKLGNINLRILHILIPNMEKLKSMIGLSSVKNKVIDQILYFVQGYHNTKKCYNCRNCFLELPCMGNQTDMLHTCITGNPGCGKTELGKILAGLYNSLEILETDRFNIFRRSDLIGEYLGQTTIKTQKCIDKSIGGVMFIDEVYSLGHPEKRDSYAKECIDTINQNLSENRNFVCIIAGYKDSVDKCFFSYNEGLARRFTFRYNIDPYTWKELKQIFESKVKEGNFTLYYESNGNELANTEIEKLFSQNKDNFKNGGGDMETLFLNSRIIHSRNINNDENTKYVLQYDDIKKGIEMLVETRMVKDDRLSFGMYL